MLDLKQLTEEIKDIALKAGDVILSVYNSGEMEISEKSDASPLTIADKKANDVICAGLEALKDQFPIISEENKEIAYDDRKGFKRFWVVDPLDGTKEFIKRNGEFTVNIALVEDHSPILGVVYTPCTGELFYGYKDGGAFLED